MSTPPTFTGGCQCGAVRYKIIGELLNPHICHCRMCQKAFGSFFAPLAGTEPGCIEWTRGAPAVYQSSTYAERGFCSACGTPLTIRDIDSGKINISLGSLHQPALVKPRHQYGVEARMPWFDELTDLPGSRIEDNITADVMARIKSHQHPDHD